MNRNASRRTPTGRRTPCRTGVLLLLALLLVIGACVAFVGRRQMQNLEYPRKYETYVTYYADKYDLDPLLLYAFIRTESNFDPEAESSVGARGLMQLPRIPSTGSSPASPPPRR